MTFTRNWQVQSLERRPLRGHFFDKKSSRPQFDFSDCNLVFTQVVATGEAIAADTLTLSYIARYSNFEVPLESRCLELLNLFEIFSNQH